MRSPAKVPENVSSLTAACMLQLFAARRIELDEDSYDMLCDVIYDLLEKVRDERFRLVKL